MGSVKDASGAVVASVAIHATEQRTGIRHDTTANDRGDFTLPFLPVGRLSIEAEIKGFKTFSQSGIDLEAGQEVQLPVRLEVGAMSDKVTVTAEAPLLQTASPEQEDRISTQQIASLPHGNRDITGLLALENGYRPAAMAWCSSTAWHRAALP